MLTISIIVTFIIIYCSIAIKTAAFQLVSTSLLIDVCALTTDNVITVNNIKVFTLTSINLDTNFIPYLYNIFSHEMLMIYI